MQQNTLYLHILRQFRISFSNIADFWEKTHVEDTETYFSKHILCRRAIFLLSQMAPLFILNEYHYVQSVDSALF